MVAVLGGEAAGRNPELLQGVRERQRQIHVLLRVVVHRPVEDVGDGGGQPARHRNAHAARHASVVDDAGLHRRARQHKEIGDLPPLKRQFDYALLLDHVADARAPHVHERRRGFHRDGLFERPKFERRVDRRRGAHLQHDAGLHVGSKALQRHFEAVRAGRQVGDNVAAVLVGDRRADEAGRGLGCGDRDPR